MPGILYIYEYGDGNLEDLDKVVPKTVKLNGKEPVEWLDDLENFYENHPHPKGKGMSKHVRGGVKSNYLNEENL